MKIAGQVLVTTMLNAREVQMWTEWTSKTLPDNPLQRAELFRLIAQLIVGTGQADSSRELANDDRN